MAERIRARETPLGRWEVFKCDCYMCDEDGFPWKVGASGSITMAHPTWAEAIAYADRMARTNQGENK